VNFATDFFSESLAITAQRFEPDLKIKHRIVIIRFKSESVWDHLDSSFLYPLETPSGVSRIMLFQPLENLILHPFYYNRFKSQWVIC